MVYPIKPDDKWKLDKYRGMHGTVVFYLRGVYVIDMGDDRIEVFREHELILRDFDTL